jgi:hypothetical protein
VAFFVGGIEQYAIWSDNQNMVEHTIPSLGTVAVAMEIMCNTLTKHISCEFGLGSLQLNMFWT